MVGLEPDTISNNVSRDIVSKSVKAEIIWDSTYAYCTYDSAAVAGDEKLILYLIYFSAEKISQDILFCVTF